MTNAPGTSSTGNWRETPKSVFMRLPRPESPKDFLKRMSAKLQQQQAAAAAQQQAPAAPHEQ